MRREGDSVRNYKECLDCDRLAKKDGEDTPRLIPSPRLDRGPATEHLGGPHEIGEGHLVIGAGTRVGLPSGQSFKGLVLVANVTIRAVRERGQYIAETITADGH